MHRPHSFISASIAAALLASALLANCTAKTVEPGSEKNPKAALINAQLGTEYLRKGMLEEAKFKLERSLEQGDDIALAHSSYALLMVRIGDRNKARRHFKKALRLGDEDPDTFNNFGLFLCAEKEVEEALEYFERAHADPFYKTPEIALSNAGVCLSGAGRHDEGLAMVYKAIEANPEYGVPYYQRAHIRMTSGDVRGAKLDLENFHRRFGYTLGSLQLCLDVSRKLGQRQMAADCLGVMGRKYSNLKEYREAVEELRNNPIR